MYLLYCFSSVSSKTKRDAEPENPHGNDVINVIRHGFRLYQIRRTYYCKLLPTLKRWLKQFLMVTARHVLDLCGSELSMDVRRFTFSSVSSCTEITATQARRMAVDETATCVQSVVVCGPPRDTPIKISRHSTAASPVVAHEYHLHVQLLAPGQQPAHAARARPRHAHSVTYRTGGMSRRRANRSVTCDNAQLPMLSEPCSC